MQIVASVIGLAPIRVGLKTRLLELLCIHGQKAGALGAGKHGVAAHWQALTPWNPILHGGERRANRGVRASCR